MSSRMNFVPIFFSLYLYFYIYRVCEDLKEVTAIGLYFAKKKLLFMILILEPLMINVEMREEKYFELRATTDPIAI